MCLSGGQALQSQSAQQAQSARQSGPACAADAVAMVRAALGWLASADAASLTCAEQADCLRELEQAGSMRLAARSAVLSAFTASAGYEKDGQGSARTWLRWRTQISTGAAAAAMAWARRLAAHTAVRDALAEGQVSESFARQICEWSDVLPEAHRADADTILLTAAAGGAELADLAALAEEMRQRTARPDADGGAGGFAGRWVRLETTFGGAGRLEGDLTPACAAALAAMLESLGKRAGPEDLRSKRQRDHDALEEAARRLAGAGYLPDRAGQPSQIQLHMTLDQLRGLAGSGAADAWAAERASQPGWLDGPGGCDQPPAACQPHHLIPRSKGGRTSLAGLLLLCTFHHLIAVHRWGWDIVLHTNGTTTATSPDGKRTLHSHGPPSATAA